MDLFERGERHTEGLWFNTLLRGISQSDATGFVPQNVDLSQFCEYITKTTRAFLEYCMREPFKYETECSNGRRGLCKSHMIFLPTPTFTLTSLSSAISTFGKPLSPKIVQALSDSVCWLCKSFETCTAATAALSNNEANTAANFTVSTTQVFVDQDGEFHSTDCILPRSTRQDGIKGPIIRFSLTGFSLVTRVGADGERVRGLVYNCRKPSKNCELNFPMGSRGTTLCQAKVW